jgi:hypothetical protein
MPATVNQGASPTVAHPFQFVQSRELNQRFDLSKFQRLSLRNRLPEGIYWIQPDKLILWNLKLVTDYLLNGDTPQHQRLVEAYLLTLPQH